METGAADQDKVKNRQDAQQDGDTTVRDQVTPHSGASTAGSSGLASLSAEEDGAMPSLKEQVQTIISLANAELQEGDVGYVVSTQWLSKAQTMAEKGSNDTAQLGPVDNTGLELVPDSTTAPLRDEKDQDFVPLKPGLQMKEDYEILPLEAWEKLVRWHGIVKGSPVITRYCHNTSQNENMPNLQYEVYPPVFTLYKLPSTPPSAASTSNSSPLRVLASRHEQFYKFLRRVKKLTGIARETNVRVWKFMGGQAQVVTAQPGVLTPADSRSNSPQPNGQAPVDLGKNLSIGVDTFVSFQEGSQRELIDIKDETRLMKAEDKSNLSEVGLIGLGQEVILVLEEQITGPAGGEWASTVATSRVKNGALIKGFKATDSSLQPGANRSGRSSPTPSIMTRGRPGKGRAKGTSGLGNLGNTCYMNSALQCLRNCQELTEYFLNDFYKRELNPTNPLGNHGDVAKAYAGLLKEIYRNESSSFSPRQFRQTMGKYNPQFSGYQQQDSQEFILFLLDGLHEDLNRITQKPYIEKPDSTDEMVENHDALVKFAEENWRIYKARNDSVITDLFAGMYKSTLRCPHCNKVSIIFDPYNNLTLQLPVEDTWAKHVIFFPLHARPVKVTVEVRKTGTIGDVKAFVSNKVGVEKERLVFAEIYNKVFYQLFGDDDGVHEIRESDVLAAYEVEAKPTNLSTQESKKRQKFTYYNARLTNDEDSDTSDDPQQSERILVPIVHRRQGARANLRTTFGTPSFIVLTHEEARSYETIMRKVWDRVSTMTTHPFLDNYCDAGEADESDVVVMNTEDAEESGSSEGKVQTNSVQGEDGLVDVSMRDAADDTQPSIPRIAYPPMAPLHKDIHPTLADSRRLPEELDKRFTVSLYKENNGKQIPVGLSVPSENKAGQTLRSRRAKQKSDMIKQQKKKAKVEASKQLNLKKAIRNGTASPSESEDELNGLPPPAQRTGSSATSPRPSANGSGEESDEDGVPPVQEATDGIAKSQDDSEPPPIQDRRFITNEVSPEPLIGLGCGLTIDWMEDDYLDFFGGSDVNSDGDKGMPTWDSMMTLPDPELDQKRLRRSQRKKQGVTLDECMDEFGKTEILSENDAWYCPRCKEHRRAEKTFELWKLPDILVIHLKRFAVQGRLRDKLDLVVQFPIEGLDMTERMKGKETDGRELVYDLVAIDNHYGGLGGGHYTAYAKNFVDNNWYYFDDSIVSRRPAESGITGAAYLLFYRRRGAGQQPLGGPHFDKLYAALDSSSGAADSESGSRSDSPNAFSGEGRRLGGSSRNGSSSAYRGAGAVRQAGGGGRLAGKVGAGERARGDDDDDDDDDDDLDEFEDASQGRHTQVGVSLASSDEELPNYDQSTSYGPTMMPWSDKGLLWPEDNASERTLADDEADVSSTGAVHDDDDRSVSSVPRAGTPERMEEDKVSSLEGYRTAPSPEATELRIDGVEFGKDANGDDVYMD